MKPEERERIQKKYECGHHQVMDYKTKDDNIEAGNDLCGRCDGTGNELFSMFRECEACGGTGIKNENYDYED